MDPDYNFGDFNENTNNFNGRVRYDYYVTPDDSIWAEARIRNDPFAFLVPQVSGQAGYQRVLLREERHRLYFELGLDLSYQNFGQALPPNNAAGVSPANQSAERSIFAYKALLGYTNEINPGFTYVTRFEVLGTLGSTRATAAVDGPATEFGAEPGHLRMQWVNQFRSQIEDWLQLSVDITGRLDSMPAGQLAPWDEQSNQPTQMFDLLTTVNLVGNFDLDGEPAAEEEPEPEPEPCPVCDEPEPEPCPEAVPPAPEEPVVEEPVVEEPAAEEPIEEPTDDEPADDAL